MPEKTEAMEPQCPHTSLSPHWQEPADMGKKELASYTCDSCGQIFNYAEARQYLERPPVTLTAVAGERRESA